MTDHPFGDFHDIVRRIAEAVFQVQKEFGLSPSETAEMMAHTACHFHVIAHGDAGPGKLQAHAATYEKVWLEEDDQPSRLN